MTTKEKAENNHMKCIDAAKEFLYGIANYGGLAEPYNSVINNIISEDDLTEKEKKYWNLILIDIAEGLIDIAEEMLPDHNSFTI